MKKFNLDIPKMGYILAVRKLPVEYFGDRIRDMQIIKGYKSKDASYTHTEILGGGDRSMRIMPPRSKAIELTKFYAGRYVKILRYDDPEFEKKLRYKIAYEYALLCNTKYDKRGILSFIFPFIKQDPKRPFCSEGTCEAFQHYLPNAFNANPSETFPATIVSDPKTIVHWEGFIPKE